MSVKRYHSAYPGSMFKHEPGQYADEYVRAEDYDALQRELAEAREALQHIAAIVHTGGLRGLTDSQAVTYARQLSLPYWDQTGSGIAMGRRVDAAIDAALAEPKEG